MKKSTKVILCLAALFISLGSILVLAGIISGVNPVQAIHDGALDFTIYKKRTHTFSPNGRYAIPMEEMQTLQIDWLNGRIVIEPYDGTDIILEESCSTAFDDHNSLDYSIQDNELSVSFCPAQMGFGFGNNSSISEKELHISLPRSIKWDAVNVYAVSADISLNDINAYTLTADTVNGTLSLEQTVSEQLSFNSSSGSLSIQDSSVATVDFDTVSGDFIGSLTSCPKIIHFNSADGDAQLSLPSNSDFAVEMNSIGGSFHSAFEGTTYQDQYIVGRGTAEFEFNTVGGSVELQKT